MLDERTSEFRRALFRERYTRFIRACPQADDAISRHLAEAAFIEGRPTFVGRGGYSAQKHINAVDHANTGASLREAIQAEYGEPLRAAHLAGIAPFNLPAIRALDEAYASIGPRLSLARLWARSIGEFE